MPDNDVSHQPSGDEEDFSTLLERSTQMARPGEVVTGRVVSIGREYATIDIGYKSEGLVPMVELRDRDGNPTVREGDDVEVYFDVTDLETGLAVLSRKKAEQYKVWRDIENAFTGKGSVKPFKWIKKHPLESAPIAAALMATGGAAGYGPMAGLFGGSGAAGAAGAGAVAGDAFLPGMLAGTEGLAGGSALLGSTLQSGAAGGLANLLGPSNFTAAMAGDAYLPGALGAEGAGTPGLGSKLGSMLASGGGPSARQSILLGQMAGQMGEQQQRPMGAPMIEAVPPMARQGMRTQEEITKAWLLKNDPATYARMYGMPPQMAQGGMYG